MNITLNGQAYILKSRTSLASLVDELQLDRRKVAIEHNLAIVPPDDYEVTYIAAGDVLEVVQFIGGG